MIGAIQGCGSATTSSIEALPVGVAGNRLVLTLTVVGAPLASLLRQLTTALKVGEGFVPARPAVMAAGSFGSITRPLTFTSILPLVCNSPRAALTTQGRPPPLNPRTGLTPPVYGRGTPTIVSNSSTFGTEAKVGAAWAVKKTLVTSKTATTHR